jgi:hypothetical protein
VLIAHAVPDTESQPVQPPKVEPEFGVAVSVRLVPDGKLAVQVIAQLKPNGELTTVPEPMPVKSTVNATPEKQMTAAVMFAVTIAPVEVWLPPSLLLVCTVAETKALPQAMPVAVSTPLELTVTTSGVFEAH